MFSKASSWKKKYRELFNDSQQNEDEQSIPNESRNTTKRKMSKNTVEENELIKKLSSRLSDRLSKQDRPVDQTDSDLHFLLSLYDRFKDLDNHLKLQAQIDQMPKYRSFY